MEGGEVKTIRSMVADEFMMPNSTWAVRDKAADRVLTSYIPCLPEEEQTYALARARQYQRSGCDRYMAVFCAVLMGPTVDYGTQGLRRVH